MIKENWQYFALLPSFVKLIWIINHGPIVAANLKCQSRQWLFVDVMRGLPG